MTPYKTGAPLYVQAGWPGILPLPPNKKSPPPTGYTGWNGKDPSLKMIEMWSNETTGDYQAASNIAIHMPDDVIGIDTDHYDGKTGGTTLHQLEQELGPLPTTYLSTSRSDGVSCIRWYRVEPGLRWPTGPGKDIEFIHKGHRYAIVWPSIHPKTEQQYKWYDHASTEAMPPEPDNLAWLPDEWQARFTGGEQRREQDIPQRHATDDELAICLTDGPICYAATKALAKFDDRLAVQARHDSALRTVMALMRLGEQGHKGSNAAIADLKNTFVNLVTKDRADGSEGPEYERMVDGGIVKVCAEPTADTDKGCCGAAKKSEIVHINLPQSFWDSRDALGHIQQAAHSQGRSADAVLYAVIARISAMVSPELQWKTCMGRGSLNMFSAIVGKSGRGKSVAVDIAMELVPTPNYLVGGDVFRDGIGLGSGEGIAELYMGLEDADTGEVTGPKSKVPGSKKFAKVRAKVRDNAFIYVDEGQTLVATGGRKGTTIMPTLRSAADGATLGQANAQADTYRHVSKGSYALGLVIGFQKSTAQPLLEDVVGGTPQRFGWASATDPRIPDQPPKYPGPLSLWLNDGFIARKGAIVFAKEINDELWQDNLFKARGGEHEDENDLDSHQPRMLAKLSALLCILDGRFDYVTLEDWALAKVMFDTSKAVIDDLVEYGHEDTANRIEVSANLASIRGVKVKLAEANADHTVRRIGTWIYTFVADSGGVATQGTVRREMAGRDRPLFEEALTFAIASSWVTSDGKKLAIGLDRPSA